MLDKKRPIETDRALFGVLQELPPRRPQRRFIYTTGCSIFGKVPAAVMDETHRTEPGPPARLPPRARTRGAGNQKRQHCCSATGLHVRERRLQQRQRGLVCHGRGGRCRSSAVIAKRAGPGSISPIWPKRIASLSRRTKASSRARSFTLPMITGRAVSTSCAPVSMRRATRATFGSKGRQRATTSAPGLTRTSSSPRRRRANGSDGARDTMELSKAPGRSTQAWKAAQGAASRASRLTQLSRDLEFQRSFRTQPEKETPRWT